YLAHELELIEVVTDQVVVVLSHAAILEEFMRARDHLAEQNVALDLETELIAEQQLMVETVLKGSNLLTTLINDVKDSGSGINPQDIPKLFNKFVDSQSLASKNSCGKGLGLAISKRFLSLMEGHIWIESEGLGKGCTATFLVKLGIAERPKMATKGLPVHLRCDVTATGSSEECL
ncbi:hypothetical protein GIB67_015405, partial [Kingdonia uniflora]